MLDKVKIIKISEDFNGQRIDNFLINLLKGIPKSKIYSIIRKGEVRVDGSRKKPSYKLVKGNEVRIPPLEFDEIDQPRFIPKNLINLFKNKVIFENDD